MLGGPLRTEEVHVWNPCESDARVYLLLQPPRLRYKGKGGMGHSHVPSKGILDFPGVRCGREARLYVCSCICSREAHGGSGRRWPQKISLAYEVGLDACDRCYMVQDMLHGKGSLEGAWAPDSLMRGQVQAAHPEVEADVGYVEAL